MNVGEKRKFPEGIEENGCTIGIDIGTQGAKAILYHPASQTIIARSSAKYDLDQQQDTSDNRRAEQHPAKWIQALHDILKELSLTINEKNLIVKSIGTSGQQHGLVALDNKYNVIRPAKLWCDVEASEEADSFSQAATRKMGKQWNIPAGFTAPKALWMKENEPKNWEKVRWIILPHDYVNLCLRSGIGHDFSAPSSLENHSLNVDFVSIFPCTDAGDASGTGIFDPVSRDYVKDLADLIDEKYVAALPKILSPSEVYGNVSPLWKQALNIDSENEHPIIISVGSGDNMMSALGSKCVSEGNAVLSLGTSGTIFGVSSAPVETGTSVAPFCDATGKHLPLVCVMSCTGVLNSVLENWCSSSEKNGAISHEEASTLAANFEPGCCGLTFLPYLSGERTPNWPNATGALLGLTAQTMKCMSSPGLIYRAALEGITFLLADALEQMRQCCDGFDPKSIFVVGGGSRNKFWRQMIADIFQLELRFPLEPESAALGAAFQAGAAFTGVSVEDYILQQKVEMEDTVVKPTTDEDTLKMYKEAFERYKASSKKLFSDHVENKN